MQEQPTVSVILPTIEEESLFRLIKEIRTMLGSRAEIIVVDKSSDAYFKRVQKTGVRVIRQKDRGVESAIMIGLRQAKGKYLASIDADGTHDLSGIKKGIEVISRGKADIVLGNRLSNLSEGSMSPYIQAGNMILTTLFNTTYNAHLHDVLTGLFVMKKSAFDSIREVKPYRAGIAFFVIELAKRGYKADEVNINYYVRKQGESKLARSKFAFGIGVASHILSR
jgi:dolichol-phosphate mannosyltransferase